jgi:hypothetical protein
VFDPVNREPITCASCEYRYPSSKEICPMCGKAAPVVEPLQPLSSAPDGFSKADCELRPSSSDSHVLHMPGLKRLIPAVVVLIVCVAVTLSFYKAHQRSLLKESASASEPVSPPAQPKPENAGKRHTVHNPVRGVHVVEAKLGTAQPIAAAKDDDPAELWKAVKRGSVSAEVTLANLYLEGKSVPQNCEQAHMLLQTASSKGSGAADTLLKSSYAERCE